MKSAIIEVGDIGRIFRKQIKRVIFVLLLLSHLQIISGQDVIITIWEDTIFCRIKSVSSAHIQYERKIGNRQVIGKFIPMDDVLEYYRNYKPLKNNLNNKPLKNNRYDGISANTGHWIIGIDAGRASLLASTVNDVKSMVDMGIPKSQADTYSKHLKHGWVVQGSIYYLISDLWGLGAKYSLFTSATQQNLTLKVDDYYPLFLVMGMKERQYIQYVGPSVIFQQGLNGNKKWQLTETISAGYVHYRDEMRQTSANPNPLIPNSLAERGTWGATAGISLNYYPQPWLSIGIHAELMYARLTKINLSTKDIKQTIPLEKDDYEYLTRLDYGLAFRFHF
jgi:hypothetical protein